MASALQIAPAARGSGWRPPRCGPRTLYIRHEKLPVYQESPWLTTQTAGLAGKCANFWGNRRTCGEIGELPGKSANCPGNRRTAVEIGELPWKSANFRGNRRTAVNIRRSAREAGELQG